VIVLDTQPVSQLQRVGSKDADRIEERLQGIPVDQVRITVITPIEQLREALLLADVMNYISGRVKVQPIGAWIVARYAFPTRLAESRFLTQDELDRIAPEHMVLHQGGPAGVVNSIRSPAPTTGLPAPA
jgi:hypothetical protein